MNNDAPMDHVADLLGGGRTVAYKTDLAHAAGSVTAGLLLSQFWYWANNRDVADREGWFWKTMPDIQEETGLTRTEQENARRRLVQLGVLEEERRGVPAKLWFRLNKVGLYKLLSKYLANKSATNLQTSLQETRKLDTAKPANKNAANLLAIKGTETTTEITTKTTAAEPRLTSPKARHYPKRSVAAQDMMEGREPEEGKVDLALIQALTQAGVNHADAQRLAREKPEECRQQLAFLPFVPEFTSSSGAYLRSAIEQGFGPPKGWQQEQERRHRAQKRDEVAQINTAQRHEARARQETLAALKAELQQRDAALWAQLVSEAEARLPVLLRGKPEHIAYKPALEKKIDEILASGVALEESTVIQAASKTVAAARV